MAAFFRAEQISKDFGGTRALSEVTFEVERGEVHALIGENGAGKSTLSRIISGDIRMSKGSLVLENEHRRIRDCIDARLCGIYMIYQELRLFPSLTVAENLMVYRYPRGSTGLINWKRMKREAAQVVGEWGLDLDVGKVLGSLPISQQQLIEILKNLSMSPRILIMDEPTSSLGYKEVEILFRIIRDMKQKGMSIIYISHFLDEVFSVSDRISVLRDGRNQGTFPTFQTTPRQVLEAMLSERSAQADGPTTKRQPSSVELLRVENLSRKGTLYDVGISLKKGEIVGVTGLLGAGKTELGRCLFGLDRRDSGRIYIEGRLARIRNVRDAMALGIGFIPEDRRREGIFHLLNLKDNMTFAVLRQMRKLGLVSGKRQTQASREYAEKLRIKFSNLGQLSSNLSGGNQQKVVIARWLMTNPRVLIADEPTRGIDVGTKREIADLFKRIAGQGLGILLMSEEADEILDLSDRIIVMRDGRVECTFNRGEIQKSGLVECVTGLSRETSRRRREG